MDELIKAVLVWVFNQGALPTIFIIVFIILWIHSTGRLHKHDRDRRIWVIYLKRNRGAAFYKKHMNVILNKIDTNLSSFEIATGILTGHPKTAFSFHLFNLAILSAIIYPITAVFLHWIISGNGTIAGMLVIPEADRSDRLTIVSTLIFSTFLFIISSFCKHKPRTQINIRILATIILSGTYIYRSEELGTVLCVIIGLVVVIGLGSSLVLALSLCLGLALVITIGQGVGLDIGLLSGLFLGVGLGIYAIMGLVILNSANRIDVRINITYYIVLLVIVSFIVFFALSLNTTNKFNYAHSTILFIIILPMLNGLSDFLSIGATRYFLRQGVEPGQALFKALIDSLCGITIFSMLIITIILWIGYVRPQNGLPLLNLQYVFEDLKANPTNFWWLAFMLLSTLIPTALHGVIGTMTLMTMAPKWLRLRIVIWLHYGAKGYRLPGFIASALLTTALATSFCFPFFTLYMIIFEMNHGVVLQTIIQLSESFAYISGSI